MEIRSAIYSKPDNSMIDCEIDHPQHGWIPTSLLVEGDDRPELVEAALLMGPSEYVAPEKTDEQNLVLVESAVQLKLDTEALKLRYDGIKACGIYTGFANPYQAECLALCKWAADCWVSAYAALALDPQVSPSDVIDQLPALVFS